MISEAGPAITDLHKRALRAFLVGADEEWEVCASEIQGEGDSSQGYPTLFAFALGTMVRRRFPPPWSWTDVIRYVADLRIKLDEQADELNPRLAENVIRFLLSDHSLNEPPLTSANQEEVAGIQQMLLVALTAEADLDDAGVDELINEAAEAAMAAA
ncbi:hypothetical protein BKA00_002874 [Actinomadura coerulea]|uniref:Uncharacterized protein n=1 Tax=Actinomadura coerulea TaxID=46159 RepID=A0A7X0FY88_9ACTN|nr:hypothetical protein [Actinomadura coerulea]MBB6395960.1 hypothetical protein [Actinomadura coerulea]GGQ30602.1 hypothetical protein GCM10010187_54350 [Actinomadura coerulea]